ncbi:MAG: hypothetical protein KJ601_08365 [Nanoarchaeota archaeon]|nr:hypothetical protein [Nanoarchaeota archaeon]
MKYLLIPLFLIVLASTAFAASLNSEITPQNPAPGSDVKLVLKTAEVPNAKWFVAYDIAMQGGCVRKENSEAEISGFLLDEVSADQTKEYNIKMPDTGGPCTFNIEYQFTGSEPGVIELTTSAAAATPTPEIQPAVEPVSQPTTQSTEIVQSAQQAATKEPTDINKVILIIGSILLILLLIFFILFNRRKKRLLKNPSANR